jgi:hypothetical protein
MNNEIIDLFKMKYECQLILGKGQNYEYHNVKNQKDLRKLRRRSEHRKDLLKRSERRKSKRSERRKANYHNVEKS